MPADRAYSHSINNDIPPFIIYFKFYKLNEKLLNNDNFINELVKKPYNLDDLKGYKMDNLFKFFEPLLLNDIKRSIYDEYCIIKLKWNEFNTLVNNMSIPPLQRKGTKNNVSFNELIDYILNNDKIKINRINIILEGIQQNISRNESKMTTNAIISQLSMDPDSNTGKQKTYPITTMNEFQNFRHKIMIEYENKINFSCVK